MTQVNTTAFNLPAQLAAKADPMLIAHDEEHFAAITRSLELQIADLARHLDTHRKAPGGKGQEGVERDAEIRRISSRLRLLQRYGRDLCLGRFVTTTDPEPVYIGRIGLTDDDGQRLLVDWRAPAAEPFFAATHANTMGLASRRRYRWTRGRVGDYWDEVFTEEGLESNAALDDQSAFIASLGGSRSPKMRDVVGTIQADQDAIIRAGSRGALVVDGGPGTGKTVVALHRAAYLLYSDPRLGERRGSVLFVGPHQPYLAYVADVLPSLGEEGVQTCTLRDLVAEGATAAVESDPEVARLKSLSAMVNAIEPAVAMYEQPPSEGLLVETPWAELWLGPADWADAFAAAEPGTPHNETRDQVWEALLVILAGRLADDGEVDGDGDGWETGEVGGVPSGLLRRALLQNTELAEVFNRAWPLFDATILVANLFSAPGYLHACAPWLTDAEVRLLQRPEPRAWTESDLPLLDAARQRLGDPQASRRRESHRTAVAEEREQMARVVDELIAADDDGTGLVTMLRQADLQPVIIDEDALAENDPDLLAGPFAHVVVDEAQELSDAQWHMLLSRCPSRSFTIVGDRAQARHGFTESWEERLQRVGFRDVAQASLGINYRTPVEVMAEAEPVIRAALPDANVPTSVRSSGIPVIHAEASELGSILERWLAGHEDGIACVIGDPAFASTPRIRSLTPELAKGLEFDLVVLVDPDHFGTGIEGAVDRYVSMTRATQRLVVLSGHGTPGKRAPRITMP